MPSPLNGLISLVVIFLFSAGIAFIARFFYLLKKSEKTSCEESPVPPVEKNIYYIKNITNLTKKRRRRRKRPDVALKKLLEKTDEISEREENLSS